MMVRSRQVGALLVAGALTVSFFGPSYAAEEEVEAGNNLSYPVLWAETDGRPVVPGTMGIELFDGQVLQGTLSPDSTDQCWGAVQKDLKNSWQAENLPVEVDHAVTTIDWGDNIEVKDWKIGPQVRVETGLYDDAVPAPMNKYEMCYISGKGEDEIWGAQLKGNSSDSGAVTTKSSSAMVFTAGARLTIQRISDPTKATWDAVAKRWVGDGAKDPIFNSAVYEKTADGPGSYGAELNVQGKLIYGYNWPTTGLYNGEYRITFSLDGPNDAFGGSGTSLADAEILVSEETEVPVTTLAMRAGSGGGGGGGGGGGEETAKNVPVVLGEFNLTYIDVALSGGEDAPADDGGGTTPPPDGGGTTPPPSSPAPTSPVTSQTQTGPSSVPPVANAPGSVNTPELGQGLIRQTARIRAPRTGAYELGRTLLLAPRPVKTSAGVTVRWMVTEASEDNCVVRKRDGRVTLDLVKAGTCRLIAYAPAPSPEHLRFRETRTYRILR